MELCFGGILLASFTLMAVGLALILKEKLLPGTKEERRLNRWERDLDAEEAELDAMEKEEMEKKKLPVARRIEE